MFFLSSSFILQFVLHFLQMVPVSAGDLPIILGWNDFFNTGNIIETIAPRDQVEKCAKQCEYSADQKNLSRAAAVVFHAISFHATPRKSRRPDQLYVYFNLESPMATNSDPPPGYFNLSMSYLAGDRLNLHAPYGALHPVNFSNKEDLDDMWSEDELLKIVRRKRKLVLEVVSNCSPHSGRLSYSRELEKQIEVTNYGKCFHQECDNDCYWREMDDHFFYLAFENAVCRNYVTEKFWQPFRRLTVPIVLSRAAMGGLPIPADSFIAADDFSDVQQMAKFLEELRHDEKRYLSYFNWTRTHRRRSEIEPSTRAICRLCELAHQKLAPGSLIIRDIREYWHGGGGCQADYAKRFIRPDGGGDGEMMPKDDKIDDGISRRGEDPLAGESVVGHYHRILLFSLFLILLLAWAFFIRRLRRIVAVPFQLLGKCRSFLPPNKHSPSSSQTSPLKIMPI